MPMLKPGGKIETMVFMKKLLLTLLGVLIALPTFAQDFSYSYEGQTITYTVISEGKTCSTKSGSYRPGNDVSGDLILPSHPKDGDTKYTLTSIGDDAFNRCSGLTAVSIPNSVTEIRDFTFCDCI